MAGSYSFLYQGSWYSALAPWEMRVRMTADPTQADRTDKRSICQL
jgi:hypothetical protein